MAAGTSDEVETVNSQWASYDRTGVQMYQTFWQTWFGAPPTNPGTGYFDSHVIWDYIGHQYIQIVDDYTGIYLSVSTTSSQGGNWCVTRLPMSLASGQWGDFPLVGVDSNAIWITYNVYNSNGTSPHIRRI